MYMYVYICICIYIVHNVFGKFNFDMYMWKNKYKIKVWA